MKKETEILAKLLVVALIIFTVSCKSNDDDSSPPDSPPDDGLIGNYSGTWNSTTSTGAVFTDFQITVKIIGESIIGGETVLSGEFFATSNFTSCCGGINDGTMTIRILDDAITSFSFNDQIIGCTGNFTGSGEVNTNDAFVIDFTGNDCDGDHVGQMFLSK